MQRKVDDGLRLERTTRAGLVKKMRTAARRPRILAAILLLLTSYDARSAASADTGGSHSAGGCVDGDDLMCSNVSGSVLPSVCKLSATERFAVEESGEYDLPRSANEPRADQNFAPLATAPSPGAPPTLAMTHSRISAVLVLTLKDAHLATLLLETLRACGAMDIFRELFVVVPSQELDLIEAILSNKYYNTTSSSGTCLSCGL